jgi:hypothetical protein
MTAASTSRKNKRNALIFLGLAVLLTVLLAGSLSQVEFQPGLPPPVLQGRNLILPEAPQPLIPVQSTNYFRIYLVGIILAIYLLVMLFRWIMGLSRKDLLKSFLILLGIISIAILISYLIPNISVDTHGMPVPTPLPPPEPTPLGPTPPALTWLVGVGLAVLGAFLFYAWLASRKKTNQASLIAQEIEKARQDLLSGMDLEEVIMRCYQHMSLVLQQEAGVERQAYMTPAEFEHELVTGGFPRDPVKKLTYLFENVRYGNWTPTHSDERAALESLDKIINHLREGKERDDDK